MTEVHKRRKQLINVVYDSDLRELPFLVYGYPVLSTGKVKLRLSFANLLGQINITKVDILSIFIPPVRSI